MFCYFYPFQSYYKNYPDPVIFRIRLAKKSWIQIRNNAENPLDL